MLVLSRKEDERLVINGNIEVSVVRIQGNRVTLGVSAPQDVKVLRGELVGKDKTRPANGSVNGRSDS
jgi:carbon storage regulator